MRPTVEKSNLLRLTMVAVLVAGTAVVLDSGAAANCGACADKGGDTSASATSCGGGCAGKGGCAGNGGCGKGGGGNAGRGKMRGAGPGGGHGAMGQGGGMAHHDNIQALLDNHTAIQRHVEEIEGGVDTVTTSSDPEVVKTLRAHVRQMQQRVESGQGMRWWDPMFVEIFRHHDKIDMQIEDIPGGVRVRETSTDPEVVKLIRQHALRGVSEFVDRGRARAGEPTPLPEDYRGGE